MTTSSSPSTTLVLIGAERMLRDLFAGHLRATAPDLTIIESESAEQIDPDGLPAGAVLAFLEAGCEHRAFLRSIQAARRALPHNTIAIISGFRNKGVQPFLELGVTGYVSTQMTASALIHTLRLLLAGGEFMSPVLMSEAADEERRSIGDADQSAPDSMQSLTRKERAVLLQLQQGKPNKVIGAELAMEENTVKAHLRNMMRRFGARNRVELVLTTSRFHAPPSRETSQ
jgi:two-component system, NarL family, nitrate/nitrite response regulator NarL